MRSIAIALGLSLVSGVGIAGPMLPATIVPDPMPTILPSGISVVLEPFVTVPNGKPQYIQPIRDGSGRLAINETGGRVFLTTRAGGALGTAYLDLTSTNVGFGSANGAGLMGLAFHPNFASNGKLYTAYEATTGSGIAPIASSTPGVYEVVVREWTATNPSAPSFAGTSREVLRIAMPSQGHTIGSLGFNPNATGQAHPDFGKLYVAMGDAGDNASYSSNAQNTANPYGKVLRLDPTPSSTAGYTIPGDNPFAGQGGKEELIWAFGLRNPQHLSWERGGSKRMFVTDIGESRIEEVNIGVAGGNYGWSQREGTFATFRDPTLGVGFTQDVFHLAVGPDGGLLHPVAQYDHDEGRAIGAGVLYEGSAIAELLGKFIVSDIVEGRLFLTDIAARSADDDPAGVKGFTELALIYGGAQRTLLDILGALRADARLGVDDDGEVYVLTKANGEIFRLATLAEIAAVPAPSAAALLVVAIAGLLSQRPRL